MTHRIRGDRLLLDTNVVLWLLLGDRSRVPDRVRTVLADEDHELFVSAVSVWEIAIKRSLGKLEIDARWSTVLRELDFTQLPATAEHAVQVEHLPWHHRDPFDRFLVAQAQVEQCTLVTADGRLSAYDVPILWGPDGSAAPRP